MVTIDLVRVTIPVLSQPFSFVGSCYLILVGGKVTVVMIGGYHHNDNDHLERVLF